MSIEETIRGRSRSPAEFKEQPDRI